MDATQVTVDPAAPTRHEFRKAVVASAVGTFVEWYDFALYGAASALVIGPLFFPQAGSSLVGTLAAFATFAVGYVARPVGGVVLGHLGDRIGRRPTMVLTVALMGGATLLIGLLPTYETVGVLAPVLLVLLRLLQGFGAGAELAGGVILVAEYAPERRRAFWTSIPFAATGTGLLAATLTFYVVLASMSQEALLSWGWRIPFLSSIVMLGVALFIRRKVGETPEFVAQAAEAAKADKLPVRQLFAERGRNVFFGFLSIAGYNANAYIVNTFALSYLVNSLDLAFGDALLAVVIASVAGIVATPLFGALSDRIGYLRVYALGTVFVALFAYPFFALLGTRELPLVILALTLAYGIGYGSVNGAQPAFLCDLFPTRYRYTGVAVTRELNGVAVAGPTALVATALIAVTGGSPWLVAAYLVVLQLVTLVGLAGVRTERSREALTDQSVGR